MANPANTLAYVGNDGRLWVDVTEAKTLVAADSGYVQNVIYASGVCTLPATAVQGVWTIRNGGVPKTSAPAGTGDNGNGISVDCDSNDTIIGFNVADGASANGKALVNTAATAHVGDEVEITSVASTNGPYLTAMKGVWLREV